MSEVDSLRSVGSCQLRITKRDNCDQKGQLRPKRDNCDQKGTIVTSEELDELFA